MKLKTIFLPASFLLAVFVFIWIAKPQWDINKQNERELKDKEKILNELVEKESTLRISLGKYNNLSENIILIDNAVPFSPMNDVLIAELNEQAVKFGVFVEDIALSDIKKEVANIYSEADSATGLDGAVINQNDLLGSDVVMNIFGNYLGVRDFIEVIGKTNRYASLRKTEISSNIKKNEVGEVEKNGTVNAKISFQIFYRPSSGTLPISNLIFSGDEAMLKLLGGGISVDAVEDFKTKRTSQAYNYSFSEDGVGKEDVFKKESSVSVRGISSEQTGNYSEDEAEKILESLSQ